MDRRTALLTFLAAPTAGLLADDPTPSFDGDVSTWGTLRGRVVWRGEVPAPKVVPVRAIIDAGEWVLNP